MKKTILGLIMMVFALAANAQQVVVNNFSPCDIEVAIWAEPQGANCRHGIRYLSTTVSIAPGGNHTFDRNTMPWAGTAPAAGAALDWVYVVIQSSLTCSVWGTSPSGCEYDLTSVGPCSNMSSCMEVNHNCNTCPMGSTVNATWTNIAPGIDQVDIN